MRKWQLLKRDLHTTAFCFASRHLVTTAKEEGRVILTADTTFLRAR